MSAQSTTNETITGEHKRRIQDEFHIPVDVMYQRAYLIISLDEESQMPTDEELVQLRSYCEFVVRKVYNESYAKKLLEDMSIAADAGHNTVTFQKRIPDGGWCYRRSTWTVGPSLAPSLTQDNYQPHSLVQVMDKIEGIVPEKWKVWKNEHSDIFPQS